MSVGRNIFSDVPDMASAEDRLELDDAIKDEQQATGSAGQGGSVAASAAAVVAACGAAAAVRPGP